MWCNLKKIFLILNQWFGGSVKMTYFSNRDHQLLCFDGEHTTRGDNDLQSVYDKFFELHNLLNRRFRDHNYDLHPHWNHSAVLSSRSAACTGESNALALPYFRSKEQATLV